MFFQPQTTLLAQVEFVNQTVDNQPTLAVGDLNPQPLIVLFDPANIEKNPVSVLPGVTPQIILDSNIYNNVMVVLTCEQMPRGVPQTTNNNITYGIFEMFQTLATGIGSQILNTSTSLVLPRFQTFTHVMRQASFTGQPWAFSFGNALTVANPAQAIFIKTTASIFANTILT